MKLPIYVALLLTGAVTVRGQSQGYTTFNRAVNQDGAGVVYLDEKGGEGGAWVKGMEFTEGTIEVDIKGRDVLQQSFVGIAFHGENDSTYEVIYFRPFNFRNADTARRAHAVQYIALPAYDWPVLRERYPNKYEQPIVPPPDPNEWFHAKIVVTEERISVFVNGASKPSLVVAPPLVHRGGRQVGYWVGNGSNGWFRSLKLTKK